MKKSNSRPTISGFRLGRWSERRALANSSSRLIVLRRANEPETARPSPGSARVGGAGSGAEFPLSAALSDSGRFCRRSFRRRAARSRESSCASEMLRGTAFVWAVGAVAVAVAAAALAGEWEPNPEPPHLLLLMDSSSSMTSQNRFEKMNVAVRGWIENLVPEGIKLSLWKFASEAVEIKSAMIDNTSISRQEIMNFIPEVESRSSCIACAIETVLKQVKKKFTVLLITDAEDKFLEQDLKDLAGKIETSQSRIMAVLMGNSLDNTHLLEELTGGSLSHVADTNSVLSLLDAFQAALLTLKNFSVPINIYEEEFSSSEDNFHSTFTVDSSVVQNICINLYYWPHNMPLSVELLTPKGDSKRIPNKLLKSGNLKYCQLPEMVGIWKFQMFSSTFNKFIALQITATINETEIDSEIIFNCWIEMGESYLSICGSVHPGKYLINETKISVDIIAQDGNVTKRELLKLYSESNEYGQKEHLFVRKHLNILNPGYYSARCWATGQVWQVPDTDIEPQKFTRISWAGTFQMDKTNNGLSLPSAITDLIAFVETQVGKCSIIIEFSAPINAVKYKLILSSSLYDILSDDGLTLATVPGIAGTREKITFRIPSKLLTPPVPLYVAMSTIGENGVEGEISNIVSVMCHKKQIETSTPTSNGYRTSTIPTSPFNNGSNPNISFTTPNTISSSTISVDNPIFNSSFLGKHPNFSSSLTSPVYERNLSVVTEVSNFTTLTGFTSNVSHEIERNISNTSVAIQNDNDSQPFNIIGAIGILIGVLLTAVAGILIYHTLYNQRRCKSYEVASRQSNSQDPFNENDEL